MSHCGQYGLRAYLPNQPHDFWQGVPNPGDLKVVNGNILWNVGHVCPLGLQKRQVRFKASPIQMTKEGGEYSLRPAAGKRRQQKQDPFSFTNHQETDSGRFTKTNSLQPKPPPTVWSLTISKPRLRRKSNTASGFATSNGYPPNQSRRSVK